MQGVLVVSAVVGFDCGDNRVCNAEQHDDRDEEKTDHNIEQEGGNNQVDEHGELEVERLFATAINKGVFLAFDQPDSQYTKELGRPKIVPVRADGSIPILRALESVSPVFGIGGMEVGIF